MLDSHTRSVPWAQFCGGVVIGRRRVLTAAHCVIGKGTRDVDVLIGRTRLSEPGGRRIHVSAISVYPGLADGRQPGLDAAVVVLAGDAGVAPLALVRPGQESLWPGGAAAWTIGWGQLNARESPGGNDYFADRLRQLEVPIQTDAACENAYGIGFGPDFPYRPAWLICAGSGDGRTGACFGDSGGPLVVGDAGSWLDVGVLSGGDACAARGYFDLYARVDRISRFALASAQTAQPDPLGRPRIIGRLAAGAVVRCARGRWGGDPARFSFRWSRLGDRSHRVLGRRPRYRLRRPDARSGVRCTITAVNRGGRNTVAAELLRKA